MSIWWAVMAAVGAANFLAAGYIVCKSLQWNKAEPESKKTFALLRACVMVFVSVAAYRSVFVSSYPDRLVWFDSILNSPFLIRCLATFAELSAVTTVAVVLMKLNREYDLGGKTKHKGAGKFYARAPIVSIVCIFTAQFFAFGGLITQYLSLFAVEESLWALAFLCFVPLVLLGLRRIKSGQITQSNQKLFFRVLALWCGGYLAFQIFYALPFMYFLELAGDAGKMVPPGALHAAIFDYTVTRGFHDWGGIGFMIWHSVYFSVTAWVYLFGFMAARKNSGGKFLN